MLKNKMFWYACMMPGSIAGWLFIICGIIFPFGDEVIRTAWLVISGIWVIGHPLELINSIPIGKKAGLGKGIIIAKTLLFGIAWWLPLKMGVIDK